MVPHKQVGDMSMDEGAKSVTKSEMELLREFAHEVHTPLTAMLGYTAFLSGEGDVSLTPEQSQDFAKRLHASTKRLLQITERVLDEAVRGEPTVKKEKLDFTKFSDEILKTFEADAQARGIKLVQEIAANFPILYTDPVLLYEMLSNLLSNALKFTPKGGTVKIKGGGYSQPWHHFGGSRYRQRHSGDGFDADAPRHIDNHIHGPCRTKRLGPWHPDGP
ncbi:MAG: HAMP domain-containing histidine kinase [Magnetovibrio sp.]|nr:HAMP domain-containing histidine kinase [Magnetovibrio sp.]